MPQTKQTRRMASRSLCLRFLPDGTPQSLDETARSVGVIASTEAPAVVWDWDSWQAVDEVLLMGGVRIPASGKTVFLDTHSRESVANVLGSFREIMVENGPDGPQLAGRVFYSSVAEDAWTKTREGHVTDVSIGYEVIAYAWVKEGETTIIEGRSFTGPLRVVTDWALFELSLCPIGADSNAKIRQHTAGLTTAPAPAAGPEQENAMSQDKKAGGTNTAARAAKKTHRNLETELDSNQVPGEEGENLPAVDSAEYTDEELRAAAAYLRSQEEAEEDEEARAQGEDDEEPDKEERKKPSARASDPRLLERARVLEIRGMCQQFNVPEDIENKLVSSGTGLRAARGKVMSYLASGQHGQPGGFRAEMGRTESEKFRSAATGALLLRCGINVDSKAHAGADILQGYSLREIAREALRIAGQPTGGHPLDMVGRALTTTDLPNLLIDGQRRILMNAYDIAAETWPDWMDTGDVNDFRPVKAVGIDSDLKPKLKEENGEYEYGALGEEAEVYQVRTYGRVLGITREAIVNDDLGAFSTIPRLAGEDAAATVGDVAYASVLLNPSMGDNNPLFSAAHGNTFIGGGVPTVEKLAPIFTHMRNQKTPLGKRISIMPVFFIAPVSLEPAAEQFFTSVNGGTPVIGTGDQPLVSNIYGGNRLIRIYDPRLDDADPNAWYLAGPKGRTASVFFLNGMKEPFMESDPDFRRDGVSVKVRIDVGSKAMSWRTIAMSKTS